MSAKWALSLFLNNPLYYMFVVFKPIPKGFDAILLGILWTDEYPLPLDGFQKASATALCIVVDQLDTA